jgi:hypothetical protein
MTQILGTNDEQPFPDAVREGLPTRGNYDKSIRSCSNEPYQCYFANLPEWQDNVRDMWVQHGRS